MYLIRNVEINVMVKDEPFVGDILFENGKMPTWFLCQGILLSLIRGWSIPLLMER